MAWSFATADRSDAKMFVALAEAAKRRMADFSSRGLANTVWAFTAAGQSGISLFRVLAASAELRMGEFTVHSIVNTAWAFAAAFQSKKGCASLFGAVEKAAKRLLGSFNVQDFANIV
eukprot:gnl/TRDRNA2_/TRDRNA2_174420_c18_seq12.p1 gnl/TRDRNA2_/TRDRNA2_174420_c18~~gnl/TRDRNA2_/TRDRNA2_174420_c18_seq12.p1  ORF type:complete len:117 (-),score=28.67 gnl/TRDRNA2_/TRDRNA2_174420_c18_seq12:392-742(-)